MELKPKPGDDVFPVADFEVVAIDALDGITLCLCHARLDGQEGTQASAQFLLDRSAASDLSQRLLAALAALDEMRPVSPAGSSPH